MSLQCVRKPPGAPLANPNFAFLFFCEFATNLLCESIFQYGIHSKKIEILIKWNVFAPIVYSEFRSSWVMPGFSKSNQLYLKILNIYKIFKLVLGLSHKINVFKVAFTLLISFVSGGAREKQIKNRFWWQSHELRRFLKRTYGRVRGWRLSLFKCN